MYRRILRKVSAFFLCALVLAAIARPVLALEPLDRSQGMSLTITDLPDGEDVHELLLYKIADMTDDIRFEFTEEFAILKGQVDLDILVTDRKATAKWTEIAKELLERYIPQLGVQPLEKQEYGQGVNMITFYDLEPGLYLARGDGFENTPAGVSYDFSPMLVSVPYAADDDDQLTYNVWSSAKVISATLTPTPTDTPTPTPTAIATPTQCVTCTPRCATCSPLPPTPTTYIPTRYPSYTPTPTTYIPTRYPSYTPTYTPTPYRPPVPQTGDTSNIWLPIAGIAGAVAVIALVFIVRRKSNGD